MKIQSIEELKLHIQDIRTQKAMDEVLSCFYSNNLRSTVVMLYVTVVSDLYYKIKDLVDKYNDKGAKKILEYVNKEWEEHKTSPIWESELPKRCLDCNKILKNDSYTHFESLQKERNLCAHPIINEGELYIPNAANVQGMIIDMLRGILCKPSFMSKDFFDSFVEDISSSKIYFPREEELINYLNSKYFDKIDNEQEEYEIFKNLWSLVFKCIDDKCIENRNVNYHTLNYIFEKNTNFIVSQIRNNIEYFTNRVNTDDDKCLKYFIYFINKNINIYNSFNEDFKIKIKNIINEKNYTGFAFFLKGKSDIFSHAINHISNYCSSLYYEDLRYTVDYIHKNIRLSEAIDYSIELYKQSNSYNFADYIFNKYIEGNLEHMTKEQILKIIKVSCENNQIYDRYEFNRTKILIKTAMNNINPNFDFSKYEKFK
jgi:hypothetical protein